MASPQRAVRTTAVAVGVVYAAALFAAGVRLGDGLKSALSYLPTLTTLFVVAFDKWLWRWPGIRRMHGRPILNGLWLTELTPGKDSHIPDAGNWGPIEAYIIIEQTFWSISITQLTKESESHSRAAVFIPRTESKRSVLSFTYDNQPGRKHLSRSPRHVGACEFEVSGTAPTELKGSYFTDRFTAGDMELKFADRTTSHGSFEGCQTRARQGKRGTA
jgi:SMODS-associating 2TM, beta-strand rich effector domain